MKLVKMLLTPPVAAISAALALSASAEDWYVSDDMEYGKGVVSDAHCTNDLVYAAKSATAGDTVWVKDGFICASGGGANYGSGWGKCRVLIPANVVVRSESGFVDEATGKGATIRGELDQEAGADKYYLGTNSFRCVGFNGSSGKACLIGFVLEKGSSNFQSDDQGGGGAAVGQARSQFLSNCVVRTCYAKRGGGVRGISVYDSVVTNCTTSNQGGGAYLSSAFGSLFAGNWAKSWGGGAAANCSFSNCVVRLNWCSGNGGAFCNGTAIDCVVTNNTATGWGGACGTYYTSGGDSFVGTSLGKAIVAFNTAGGRGGGVQGWAMTNVIVHSNLAQTHEGGGGIGASSVYKCVITNNVSSLNGGGLSGGTIVMGCLIADNRVTSSGYHGGGIYNCAKIFDSVISNNVSKNDGGGVHTATLVSNCVFFANSTLNSGGGVKGGDSLLVYDCAFVSNKATQTSSNSVGGGGLCGGTAYRSVFAGNSVVGSAPGGGAYKANLVSCVVTNNFAGRYGGGADACVTKNCLFANNVEGPNGSIGAGGGAVSDGTHYNALFLNNCAANYGGAAYNATCYNCTAIGNTNTLYNGAWSGGGGFSDCKLVNCISYGNCGIPDNNITWASNSCLQVSSVADAKYVDCTNVNPRLDAEFRPHARACKHTGLVFDWMTDDADVRSKDLAGNPRIADGAEKPNMGCYESLPIGMMLLLR